MMSFVRNPQATLRVAAAATLLGLAVSIEAQQVQVVSSSNPPITLRAVVERGRENGWEEATTYVQGRCLAANALRTDLVAFGVPTQFHQRLLKTCVLPVMLQLRADVGGVEASVGKGVWFALPEDIWVNPGQNASVRVQLRGTTTLRASTVDVPAKTGGVFQLNLAPPHDLPTPLALARLFPELRTRLVSPARAVSAPREPPPRNVLRHMFWTSLLGGAIGALRLKQLCPDFTAQTNGYIGDQYVPAGSLVHNTGCIKRQLGLYFGGGAGGGVFTWLLASGADQATYADQRAVYEAAQREPDPFREPELWIRKYGSAAQIARWEEASRKWGAEMEAVQDANRVLAARPLVEDVMVAVGGSHAPTPPAPTGGCDVPSSSPTQPGLAVIVVARPLGLPPLASIKEDCVRLVELFASTLRLRRVVVLDNPSLADVRAWFSTRGEFGDALRASGDGPVFVAVIGHGLAYADGAVLPLKAWDAGFPRAEVLGVKDLSQSVFEVAGRKRERVTIAWFACYGAIPRTMAGGGVVVPKDPTTNTLGVLVTAADSLQESMIDGSQLAVAAFAKGLGGAADADKDGEIRSDEMQTFLLDEVTRRAALMGVRQTPRVWPGSSESRRMLALRSK